MRLSSTFFCGESSARRLIKGADHFLGCLDSTDKGCWSDLVASRSLPIGLTGQSNYTIEGCLAAAAARGYAVAGVSYYGECWAAMGLSYYSTSLDATKCTYRCSGNAAETCGGSNALDVYESRVVKPVQGATNADLATFGPWKYDACALCFLSSGLEITRKGASKKTKADCGHASHPPVGYQDNINGQRSLPTQLTNSNNTIEACLDACSKAGARVCGLEYCQFGNCFSGTRPPALTHGVKYAISHTQTASASCLRRISRRRRTSCRIRRAALRAPGTPTR